MIIWVTAIDRKTGDHVFTAPISGNETLHSLQEECLVIGLDYEINMVDYDN